MSIFASLWKLEGICWWSLQKGFAEKDVTVTDPVVSLSEKLHDFADTSVAHLAGAMGKPVWVLIPCIPDWRWQYQGCERAWYPSMTLYRQSSKEGWYGVIEQVKKVLQCKVSA